MHPHLPAPSTDSSIQRTDRCGTQCSRLHVKTHSRGPGDAPAACATLRRRWPSCSPYLNLKALFTLNKKLRLPEPPTTRQEKQKSSSTKCSLSFQTF
ncbi:hypothetical protein CCH79_00019056 [Gambusia affinis]|uniref:Uncharacterized protein n=1 Tax=Gambusia affinis TaxID=33528 RepID=A0A315VBJ7_GAMAF|nr:hypothetical protein CCH79_00019056 [Gambusia affinis]